ncbi:hypothetical protein [Streptomyces longispororuber]|nr:hypothetical protein [Streptomyces longispororuber]
MSTLTMPERFKDAVRDAARAVQSGAWPISRVDVETAAVALEALWARTTTSFSLFLVLDGHVR